MHFRSYIQALEKLQLDIVTRNDLLGVEDAGTRSTGLFSRPREPLKNRGAVFALGDRASVLKVLDLLVVVAKVTRSSTKFWERCLCFGIL